jgi:hypothetical protein
LPGDFFPPEAAYILPIQVPPQTDGHNCGVHVLLNALSLIEHLADGGEDVELPSWVPPILNTVICDEQRSAYGKQQLFEHPFRAYTEYNN